MHGVNKRKREAESHRSTTWWGSLDEELEDSELDSDNTSVSSPPPPPSLPTSSIPSYHLQWKKPRYVEREIGQPMSTMSLSPKMADTLVDEDMSSGSSYEISPHRIYVHTLEDSDDEEREPESTPAWEVNPYVAKRLEEEARRQQEHRPVKWISPEKEVVPSSESNSLVLWRPSVWSSPPNIESPEEDTGVEPMEL